MEESILIGKLDKFKERVLELENSRKEQINNKELLEIKIKLEELNNIEFRKRIKELERKKGIALDHKKTIIRIKKDILEHKRVVLISEKEEIVYFEKVWLGIIQKILEYEKTISEYEKLESDRINIQKEELNNENCKIRTSIYRRLNNIEFEYSDLEKEKLDGDNLAKKIIELESEIPNITKLKEKMSKLKKRENELRDKTRHIQHEERERLKKLRREERDRVQKIQYEEKEKVREEETKNRKQERIEQDIIEKFKGISTGTFAYESRYCGGIHILTGKSSHSSIQKIRESNSRNQTHNQITGIYSDDEINIYLAGVINYISKFQPYKGPGPSLQWVKNSYIPIPEYITDQQDIIKLCQQIRIEFAKLDKPNNNLINIRYSGNKKMLSFTIHNNKYH